MKKIFYYVTIIIGISVLLQGCTTTLPLTGNLNDFIMMDLKSNQNTEIHLIFTSNVSDGVIIPCKQVRTESAGGAGYKHNVAYTTLKMVNDYLQYRFSNFSTQGGGIPLSFNIDEFYLYQYTMDKGDATVASLFGGEYDIMCKAELVATIKLDKDGQTYTKKIVGSADNVYIQGVGTGTQTSGYYRGSESIQMVHARNIQDAQNKIVMMMGKFLEENGL